MKAENEKRIKDIGKQLLEIRNEIIAMEEYEDSGEVEQVIHFIDATIDIIDDI